jgi:hypothetical protein
VIRGGTVSIFGLALKEGNAKLVEDLSEDLHMSLIRTAKWTDDSLAERERSRQLILSLAPRQQPAAEAMVPMPRRQKRPGGGDIVDVERAHVRT